MKFFIKPENDKEAEIWDSGWRCGLFVGLFVGLFAGFFSSRLVFIILTQFVK